MISESKKEDQEIEVVVVYSARQMANRFGMNLRQVLRIDAEQILCICAPGPLSRFEKQRAKEIGEWMKSGALDRLLLENLSKIKE